MKVIYNLIRNIDTGIKKIISLACILIASLIMIFGGIANFKSDKMIAMFKLALSKNMAKLIEDGSLSFFDTVLIAFNMEQTTEAITTAIVLSIVLIVAIFAMFLVLIENKLASILTLLLTGCAIIHLGFTFVYSPMYNEEVGHEILEASMVSFFPMFFAFAGFVFFNSLLRDVYSGVARGSQVSASEEILRIAGQVGHGAKKLAGEAMDKSTCEHCGKIMLPNAKFCNSCGQANRKRRERPTCHNCGNPISQATKFCGKCGAENSQN